MARQIINTVFPDCSSLVKYLVDNKEGLKNSGEYNDEIERKEDSFCNYQNYDSLVETLKLGKKDYNKDYLKVLDLEFGSNTTNSYFHTDSGLFYDMGEVINGAPENMMVDEEKPKKYMKIFIDIGYSGGIPNRVLKHRGIAIFKLLYTLYMQQYILDVSWICFTKIDGCYERLYFHLPQNELNIPTIAAYCSPEFFRLMLVIMHFPYKYHGCTGCSHAEGEDIKFLKSQGLYIPGGYTDGNANHLDTQEEADEYIQKIFNNYKG